MTDFKAQLEAAAKNAVKSHYVTVRSHGSGSDLLEGLFERGAHFALRSDLVREMRDALDNAEDVLRIIYHTSADRPDRARACASKVAEAGAAFDRAVGESHE